MLDSGVRRAPTALVHVSTKPTTNRPFKWQHLIVLNAGEKAFNDIMNPKHISKYSQMFSPVCLFLCNVYSCYERSLKENMPKKKKQKNWVLTTLNSLRKLFWSNLGCSKNGFVLASICNTLLLRLSCKFQKKKKKPAGIWYCAKYSKLYVENENRSLSTQDSVPGTPQAQDWVCPVLN